MQAETKPATQGETSSFVSEEDRPQKQAGSKRAVRRDGPCAGGGSRSVGASEAAAGAGAGGLRGG
jgi:hypothetical protein